MWQSALSDIFSNMDIYIAFWSEKCALSAEMHEDSMISISFRITKHGKTPFVTKVSIFMRQKDLM